MNTKLLPGSIIRKALWVLFISMVLAGCGGESFEYSSGNEIPEGPGVFSGEAGAFDLSSYNKKDQEFEDFQRWKKSDKNTDEYREFQEWREWKAYKKWKGGQPK